MTQPETSKQAIRRVRAALATAISMDALRRRGRSHYRNVVSVKSFAQQREWVTSPEAINFMGAAWCNRKLMFIQMAEDKLRHVVPSGEWFEAAWNGALAFPPQDDFCPLAVAANLYGLAAAGLIRERGSTGLRASLQLLASGADPLQVWARTGSRMRLSYAHTSSDSGRFDEHGKPIATPPTRRLMPALAMGLEDHYDRMTAAAAIFVNDPQSPSGMMIQKLAMTRGRDQTAIDRRKQMKKKAYLKKVKAIKAKFGIDD